MILHILTPSVYFHCSIVDMTIGALGTIDCHWINIYIYDHGNGKINIFIHILIITSNATIINSNFMSIIIISFCLYCCTY